MTKPTPLSQMFSQFDELRKLSAHTSEDNYPQDLEQAIEQEQQAKAKLDRLRHTFLSTVNHEMRTPLVLILQSLELLNSDRLGTLTPDQQDTLLVLQRQAEKLDRMVQSLIRVAAFLSKQEPVHPVMGQLAPVLSSVLPLAEFKARSKQVTILTDVPPELPLFPLDDKQIEEALTQLLDNAIKFNRVGGTVKLVVRPLAEWLVIAVIDSGIGIDQARLESIWEMFEQNSDPVRRAQEGLGLGLVLAKYIVEAHHGVIEVKTKPGQGSTFIIKLPQHLPD
jgi:signal transduction histidine kinase